MLRGVGDTVVLEILDAVVVTHETGVGVSVGRVDLQRPPRRELQGRFGSDAARAARVGHHPARALSLREDRELLVADINVKYREIAPHGAVHAREVAAQFVVPAVFRLVGHQVRFVVLRTGHPPFELFAQDVGEHLRVESPGLVALGYRNIEVAHFVESVEQRDLRQHFAVGVGDAVPLVDRDAFRRGRAALLADEIIHVGPAVVGQRRVFHVETDAGREPPAAQPQVRLVVNGASVHGHTEIGVERQFIRGDRVFLVPDRAQMLVGVLDDQLLDARAFEVHRGFHHAVAVETEGAQQPAVAPSVVRTENDVLGQGVFAPGLPEREPGFGREVLIERHLVVGVLVRGDRRDGIFRGVVAHRESVADRCAAVGRRVVIADLAVADDGLAVAHDVLAGVGVGITSLVERREREGVVDAHSPVVAPLRFPASSAQTLPVAFLARAVVVEEAARVGEIARHGHSEVGRELVVGRCPEAVGIPAAVFGRQPHALVGERRERVDVHHAAHRVAAVERRLGPAQDLDAFGVGQLRVEVVLVEHRDVVDIQPDDRLVDARAEAPHVDRRGHARTVVRSVEVGNRLREVFHRPDAAPFDGAAADDRRRDGLRTQHEALFDGRHLHLVHHDHRVGRLRVRRRAVAARGAGRGRGGQQQQGYDERFAVHVSVAVIGSTK